MNTKSIIASLLVGMGLSNFARATEAVVQKDTPSVEQQKATGLSEKEQLAKINEAIKQDKASHNTDQLKKDRAARREIVRSHKQEKRQQRAASNAKTDAKIQ